MLRMDGPARGGAAALQLPGLDLASELALRVGLRHWQQAVEAAEALLAGVWLCVGCLSLCDVWDVFHVLV